MGETSHFPYMEDHRRMSTIFVVVSASILYKLDVYRRVSSYHDGI